MKLLDNQGRCVVSLESDFLTESHKVNEEIKQNGLPDDVKKMVLMYASCNEKPKSIMEKKTKPALIRQSIEPQAAEPRGIELDEESDEEEVVAQPIHIESLFLLTETTSIFAKSATLSSEICNHICPISYRSKDSFFLANRSTMVRPTFCQDFPKQTSDSSSAHTI